MFFCLLSFGGLFFGRFELDVWRFGALVPALIFAASNALAEELAYRGAMRVWLAPALGVIGANLAQAAVFGLAHTGDDFDGPMAPVIVATTLKVLDMLSKTTKLRDKLEDT